MGLSLPALVPSVKRSTFRIHDPEKESADNEYVKIRRSVFTRDKFTCQYCGFKATPNRTAPPETSEASGYLEAHHVDDDHTNNILPNLVSVCPFCHQVFHAGFAGKREAATLAWIPEITQENINLLCNLIFCIEYRAEQDKSSQAYAAEARSLIASLRERREGLDALFGKDAITMQSLPSILMALHRNNMYEERGKLFSGLRLIPNPEPFADHIAWWCRTDQWGEASMLSDMAFAGEQFLGR
jgi:intracellular multiplication protein IcmJ